jgi:RNA polymerase sigma-70 factor (family 1)
LQQLPIIPSESIQRLKQGDETAFAAIYAACGSYLHYFTGSILKDSHLAEEVVQEVMTKVWLQKEQIDPEKPFVHWLRTIARNTTFDHLKKIARQRELQQQVWESIQQQHHASADDNIAYKDYKRLYEEAISLLSPQQQKVFTLSRVHEMTHEQIAGELGLSANTVRNHIVVALNNIRRYLKTHAGIFFFL